MPFHGVFSALITPFTAEEDINETALRNVVDRTIGGGIHGLVPNGSTGEFFSQTISERRRVVEIVVDQTAGRVPVLAHVGALRTVDAVELARHAEETGAAGVMAVAPFYEPLGAAEIRTYFQAIADSVSIPVMIYNIPSATGVCLGVEDLVHIASLSENIKYVKDTSGDFGQAVRLVHECGNVLTAFIGMDTYFLATFLEGGAGTIVGSCNFMTPRLISIYDAIHAGDLVRAKKDWDILFPVLQFLVSNPYVPAVKGAMEILGLSPGPARGPIACLSGQSMDELRTLLAGAAICA